MSAVRHKYSARKTLYADQWYASAAEAAYARHLDLQKAAGVVLDWKRGNRIVLVEGATKREDVTYHPDFWVRHATDGIYWVEIKGAETAVWRLKRLLWKAKIRSPLLVVFKDRQEWVVPPSVELGALAAPEPERGNDDAQTI